MQTQSSPGVDYYLSQNGVNRVAFIKNSSPPLAFLNEGILYEMNDGNLYYNGNIVQTGGSTNADFLDTTGAPVNVNLAAPPSVGQILTATDATHATWQTPSSSSVFLDSAFLIEHNGDTTKRLSFDLSGENSDTQLVLASDLLANATYSIPNSAAGNDEFALLGNNQTFTASNAFTGTLSAGGFIEFSSAPQLTASGVGLIFNQNGSSNLIELQASNPAADRVYTLPDAGASANFLLSEGSNVINATTEFTTAPVFKAPGAGLSFQQNATGPFIDIQAVQPAALRTYTLVDTGTSAANIVLDQGSFSIHGSITFSSLVTFESSTTQLAIQPGGSGNIISIAGTTPGSGNLTYTIPDAGHNANFMLTSITGATPNPTQATSNTTAVTATASVGRITMFGTIGSGASAAFTFNNVNILANSNVIAWSNMTSATLGKPVGVVVSGIAGGSCTITVTNSDGANATNAAAVVYYLIM